MNLIEMREMVANILDYSPNVTEYNNQINKILNETYLQFFLLQPWTFAQKAVDVYTIPDATQDDLEITPAVKGYFVNLITNVNTTTGIGQTYHSGLMNHEGNILQITNASTSANNGIYRILKVDPTGKVAVTKMSSNRSHVNWEGTAGVTQTVSGQVYQRYLTLPPDCNQVLSVGIRNIAESGTGYGNSLGHIYNCTRINDEYYNYRYDITGTPTMWIAHDKDPDGIIDASYFVPRANKDFSVTTTPAVLVPGWPAGTYEFKIAYELHNIPGALSDAFEIILDGTELPVFETRNTNQFGIEGLRKRVYVRLVDVTGYNSTKIEEPFFRDLGAIRNFGMTGTGADGSFFLIEDSDTSTNWPQNEIEISSIAQLQMIPRHFQPLNTRWRIRLHPRPTAETPINIRYMKYPSQLLDDHDQPECPIDTHRYLVYKACQEVLFKHGNEPQAVYYEKKAADELMKIEERYLTQRSALYIKGSFASGPGRLTPYRTLTHLPGKDGA